MGEQPLVVLQYWPGEQAGPALQRQVSVERSQTSPGWQVVAPQEGAVTHALLRQRLWVGQADLEVDWVAPQAQRLLAMVQASSGPQVFESQVKSPDTQAPKAQIWSASHWILAQSGPWGQAPPDSAQAIQNPSMQVKSWLQADAAVASQGVAH